MDKDRVKGFVEHLFRDMSGAMVAGLVDVGVRTGLFQVMSGKGPMSAEQVAEDSGLQPRYVKEWLAGMVCGGYLDYDPGAQSYTLPDEHAYLLASEGTDHYAGGMFRMAPVLLGLAPRVALAFRDGGGVPFEDFGDEGILALDLINRGNYQHRFAGYWLKALPDVLDRLTSGARVLDVGCGVGHVCLALAEAFPRSTVVGIDTDRESVRRASENADEAGLSARATFRAQSTAELDPAQPFDLITACDCVHDFTDPVRTLQEIRGLLRDDGTLFAVEPRVADRLEDNINPVATMFYGFSVFHCMTQSLARGGPGLGTCMGPARMEALVREAGFGHFDILDIKSQVNLFYRVRP